MPRQKRKESSTKIYNVTIKGANSQCMFYDAEDHEKFVEALDSACAKCDVRLGARVMMINHVHLVVHAELENMARFFKSVGARYVYYFNDKYTRTGPLWNARFYSDPLETEEAYKQATAYIYNNPVAVRIAETPDVYPWSNFLKLQKGYDPAGREALAEAGDPDEILEYALVYSEEKKRVNCESAENDDGKVYFEDNDLIPYLKKFIGDVSITDIINMGDKVQRQILESMLDLGSNAKQMERITGIALGRIDTLLA